MNSFTSLGEKR